MEFFSDLQCGDLIVLLGVKLKKVWGPPIIRPPLEFLNLRFVHTEPPGIHVTVQVFLPQYWFPWRFLLQLSCVSLNLPGCLSSFGGWWFTLWPQFSDKLRSLFDFSVSSVFYLLEWSNTFQALYMTDWKLEVLP